VAVVLARVWALAEKFPGAVVDWVTWGNSTERMAIEDLIHAHVKGLTMCGLAILLYIIIGIRIRGLVDTP
jgi:hypothetical protein